MESINQPSAGDCVSVAKALYDCFNHRDFDRGEDVISERCEIRDMATGEVYRGKPGYRKYEQNWLAPFPDAKVEITAIVASGDRVVVEFTGSGTHLGTMMGPGGKIPATGKTAELKACDCLRIQDGQIVEMRTYYDAAGLLAQLGIRATPVAA